MTDTRTPEQRRRIMQSVKSRNTGPEVMLRKLLHARGYRFRLHRADLPGSPDIVFPSRRSLIFVHGCFWHGHNCMKGRLPKSRRQFWRAKIDGNRKRDARVRRELRSLGWRIRYVWQCELKASPTLIPRLERFLNLQPKVDRQMARS